MTLTKENPGKTEVSNKNGENRMERRGKGATSDTESMAHLLKGNVGPGSLAMPFAFLNAGLWTGLALVPILGIICTHSMHLILKSSQELCKRGKFNSLSYEETAIMSFRLGPKGVRKFETFVQRSISLFLITTQLGFCCVYYVFVSQSFFQSIGCLANTQLSQMDYMLILFVPFMLICFIRDLKLLAPFSMVATVIQGVGTALVFYYLIRDLPMIETEVYGFGSWAGLPLFFGSAMFAFEAIGLVLPIENKMKHPSHFSGFTGVLNSGMMLVIVIYAAIGFFGYLRYGDTVEGSITLNLPNEVLAQTVKIMIGVAVFLTYPLQMYVPLKILLPFIVRPFQSTRTKLVAEYAFRIALVLLTFCLGAAIPNIGLFINLVGAVSSSFLALIFPPIIESVTFWPHTGKWNWILIKNICIICVGLVGFTTGTYASIKEIVLFFQYHEDIIIDCS